MKIKIYLLRINVSMWYRYIYFYIRIGLLYQMGSSLVPGSLPPRQGYSVSVVTRAFMTTLVS